MNKPPIEDKDVGLLCPKCSKEVCQAQFQSVDTEHGTLEIDSYFCEFCGWEYDDIDWPQKIQKLLDNNQGG